MNCIVDYRKSNIIKVAFGPLLGKMLWTTKILKA